MRKLLSAKFLGYLLVLFLGILIGEIAVLKWQPILPWEAKNKEKNQDKVINLSKSSEASIPSTPSDIPKAVEIARPSVVNIDTVHLIKENPFSKFFDEDPIFKHFFGEDFPSEPIPQEGKGSGFIISEDGYILTNEHVVRKATEIRVSLADGREFKGKVIGTDKSLDVAIVKINSKNLPFAKLGDSSKLRLGEWVIAIGNPFGFQHTVTAGIISAKDRLIHDPESGRNLEGLIQTDAAINRGNSGGPLVNLSGEVIGVNTAIFSPSGGSVGIGFAIPINAIKEVTEELIKHGKVVRPWIGISLQDVTKELAEYFNLESKEGALIVNVVPKSPANKAGLQRGDVILEIDHQKVKSAKDVVNMVRKKKVGDIVSLLIWRKRHTQVVKIKLGEMPN